MLKDLERIKEVDAPRFFLRTPRFLDFNFHTEQWPKHHAVYFTGQFEMRDGERWCQVLFKDGTEHWVSESRLSPLQYNRPMFAQGDVTACSFPGEGVVDVEIINRDKAMWIGEQGYFYDIKRLDTGRTDMVFESRFSVRKAIAAVVQCAA